MIMNENTYSKPAKFALISKLGSFLTSELLRNTSKASDAMDGALGIEQVQEPLPGNVPTWLALSGLESVAEVRHDLAYLSNSRTICTFNTTPMFDFDVLPPGIPFVLLNDDCQRTSDLLRVGAVTKNHTSKPTSGALRLVKLLRRFAISPGIPISDPFDFPHKAMVELVRACNLRCPLCPSGNTAFLECARAPRRPRH